jgi:3D (Asp-Asp-Asp) domain-containing protein
VKYVLEAVAILLVLVAATSVPRPASGAMACRTMVTTGYVRTELGPYTYDGTPIWTSERVVAASWDIPLGHYVIVQDLGLYRVADRGRLGSDGWVDVAVWTRAEAYQITGRRLVCVLSPEQLAAVQAP